MVRETPLHKWRLGFMAQAADYGAAILPPMQALYHKPESIMDIIHQSIGNALAQAGIECNLFKRRAGYGRNEQGKESLRVAT